MIHSWLLAKDREGAVHVQALQPPSTGGREAATAKRGYAELHRKLLGSALFWTHTLRR